MMDSLRVVRVLAVTLTLVFSLVVQIAPGAAQGGEMGPPFERVGTLTLSPGEDQLSSIMIDPAGEFAYLGTTAGVVKVDLATFERVDVLPGSSARAGVMDPMGGYAYFGLPWWQPGRVIRIDLNAFAQVDELELQLGERGFSAAVVDPADGGFRSSVIDPAGRYAYFAAKGQVVKIDLDISERVDAIALADGVGSFRTAAVDPSGEFAYFGAGGETGLVVKVRIGAADTDLPAALTPLQPGRLLDTRQPGGATVDGQFQAEGAPLADGEMQLVVRGRAGVPTDAAAAVLNVTVVEAQGAGFVTAWPCDEPRPDASSLNFTEGQTVPNAVVVKLSPVGTVCLFNAQAATDLLADVNGYSEHRRDTTNDGLLHRHGP